MTHPARAVVVGAGVAGLVSAKALLDEGVDVTVLETGDRPGGLWARESSSGRSPAYDSLHLNTSRARTQFADLPMPADWPDYPSAAMVEGYLRDYVEAFGIDEHVAYGHDVTRAERTPTGWRVEAATADGPVVLEADALVVANGHTWDPRWPDPVPPGEFAGDQVHAHGHRSPEQYEGRRVLVVGMGNSAMDVAVDASRTSRGPVLLSGRRGVHVVPKYVLGRPADASGALLRALPWRIRQRIAEAALRATVGTPQSYGLPAPAGGLFQNHPTVSDTILGRLASGDVVARPGIERFEGDRVRFTDGSVDEVDLVVWATGYRASMPFLAEGLTGPDPEEMLLFQRLFHPDDPSLTFVGLFQSTGAALPVMEAQAKLLAAHVAGRYALPDAAAQRRSVDRSLAAATTRWGPRKPMMRIDFDRYQAALARESRAGTRRAARAAGRAPSQRPVASGG